MDLAIKEAKGIVPMGSNEIFFNEKRFELAQRVAKVFATSTMVPAHFQNNIGNCLIALNYAGRVQADPFMLMQNMYIVHGRPGIEGKLVIALVNQCGRFEPMEFDEGKDYCVAFAKELKSGKILRGSRIDIALVKAEGWLSKNGSKWATMPQQMFRYRAAAFFARTFCPEVLLGMQTREEIEDIVDLAPGENGSYSLKEKTQAKVVELKQKLASELSPAKGPGSGELVDAEFDPMAGAADESYSRQGLAQTARSPEDPPREAEPGADSSESEINYKCSRGCGFKTTSTMGLKRHENRCKPPTQEPPPDGPETPSQEPAPPAGGGGSPLSFPNVTAEVQASEPWMELLELLETNEIARKVWDDDCANRAVRDTAHVHSLMRFILGRLDRIVRGMINGGY